MIRSGRRTRAILWLAASSIAAMASTAAGDHPAPELPPNAVQPPGASFERHVTRPQKVLLVKDTLQATFVEVVRHPARSALVGTGRLFERIGVLVAEAVPFGPPLPFHQNPEAGGPCTPARITPLFGSRLAFQALLDLIGSARCRVDLLMFSWDDDVAGRSVADALIARARVGVPIRVMMDHGSYVSGEGNAKVPLGCPTFLDALRAEPNVQVIETPDPGVRFDHRKLAVIDDRVAWTGGMILTRPAQYLWHNFAFLAEGPIVPQYAAVFTERWGQLGGPPAPTCPEAAGTGLTAPNASVRMIRTDIGVRSLKEAVYGAVDSAKHHIYLENCYFSDEILVRKLVAARRRGVDVRAVLTMRGDVKQMNKFAAIMGNHLYRAGARIYLYPSMSHVKAMSVDGTLAYIGTANFDDLSLRNNREVALTVHGPDLIRQIDEGLFLRDMADSEKLRAPLPMPKGRLLLEASSSLF